MFSPGHVYVSADGFGLRVIPKAGDLDVEHVTRTHAWCHHGVVRHAQLTNRAEHQRHQVRRLPPLNIVVTAQARSESMDAAVGGGHRRAVGVPEVTAEIGPR